MNAAHADTNTLLVAVSQWIDSAPANRARAPEALLWGRVAKVSEEAGETIAALVGALGHNPRKGVNDNMEHVEYELLDVAMTALCALAHLYIRRGETPDLLGLFQQHVRVVHERSGASVSVETPRDNE
ncbi:MazG-like family protein [Streptomyces sp. NPDC056161]|uniref:MazG-like family protein n=1 Tax=Streptomyces sp. NPDC056161 TaxID=3345732 RepID=UPI0035D86835